MVWVPMPPLFPRRHCSHAAVPRPQVVHGCLSPWTVRVRGRTHAVLGDAGLAPAVRYLPSHPATAAAAAAAEGPAAEAASAVAAVVAVQRYWAPEVLVDPAVSTPEADVYGRV